MTQFKKCKVVILPTEKETLIQLGVTFHKKIPGEFRGTYFHLYILSDEGIKEGDWYYYVDGSGNHIMLCKSSSQVKGIAGYYKIIATTDSSLKIAGELNKYHKDDKYLPQPSDSFIRKYCELGGIDEVMVEYEYNNHYPMVEFNNLKLKVAPDNTITIRPIKNSWNRKEVENLLDKYRCYIMLSDSTPNSLNKPNLNKWIEENL